MVSDSDSGPIWITGKVTKTIDNTCPHCGQGIHTVEFTFDNLEEKKEND